MRSLLLALLLVATHASAAPPTVRINEGTVSGAIENGINVFKGIPYAAPPVGHLRWAPPAPPKSWRTALEATEFGAACPQPERPDRARSFGAQSEDCLTLNVWASPQAKGAPVMVWIHGGAFRVGKAGTPFYSGKHFAKNGIVLVSINYRLGHLGFFAHPALTAQSGDALLGNYGIMDQIAALEWVKTNIGAFGGDPARVTIFGESAGGSSVLHLLTIDAAKPLFAQAIVQSGGGTQRPRYLSRDLPGMQSLESIGTDVAKQLGVDGAEDVVAALRAVPAKTIIEDANAFETASLGFGPMIDGKLITGPLYAAFGDGRAANVPLMIGANSYEASVLAAFRTDAAVLLDRLGPARERATSIYAGEAGKDTTYLAELIFGDVSFVAPARAVASAHSERGKTWLYHLDFVRERARDDVKGANHGADVLLVFNTLDALPMSRFLFTDGDRKVATTVHEYWVNFAKTGDPNGRGLPRWSVYEVAKDNTLVIGNDGIDTVDGYRKNQLDFAMSIITAAGL